MKRQQRLDVFLGVQHQLRPGLSFLDLPYSVRERIYSLILPQGTPVDLSAPCRPEDVEHEEVKEEEEEEEEEEDPNACICDGRLSRRANGFQSGTSIRTYADSWEVCDYRAPLKNTHIFLVNKAIRTEVNDFFYSRNHFHVSRCRSGGLAHLANLAPETLRCLRSLHIVFTKTWCQHRAYRAYQQCHNPRCFVRLKGRISLYLPSKLQKNTRLPNAVDLQFLKEWDRVFRKIAPYLDSELKLTLVADVEDVDAAMAVLRPLSSLTTTMKSLAITLDADHTRLELVNLAKEHCEKHTFTPKGVFPFLELPKELQDRILEYTHLETKTNSSSPHTRSVYSTDTNPLHNIVYWVPPGRFWPGCIGPCCTFCTDAFDTCLCNAHRRASFSTTCQCFIPPAALFQISRELRVRAIRTFYLQNKFFIFNRSRWAGPAKEFSILDFFHSLPVDEPASTLSTCNWALSSLRHLCFTVSGRTSYDDAASYSKRCAEIVEILENNTKVELLTLEAHLFQEPEPEFEEDGRYYYHVPFTELGPVVREFAENFKPLGKRLRAFYMHMGSYADAGSYAGKGKEAWDLESEAERIVMGEQYDAWAVGKRDARSAYQTFKDASNRFMQY